MGLLRDDPRWRRLNDVQTPCACCGMTFAGLPQVAYVAPDSWPGERIVESNQTLGRRPPPLLTHDFCVFGRARFIRCMLYFPLIGGEGETFGLGVWAGIDIQEFDLYVETFASGCQGRYGPWVGLLAHALPTFADTDLYGCRIIPKDGNARPEIRFPPEEQPLGVAQRDGISLDRALDILAAAGADLRPHLVAH